MQAGIKGGAVFTEPFYNECGFLGYDPDCFKKSNDDHYNNTKNNNS
jgi:hypothetical protein